MSSYKEVEESSGLLIESDDEATDDEIVCINGFDVIAPISSQVHYLSNKSIFNANV